LATPRIPSVPNSFFIITLFKEKHTLKNQFLAERAETTEKYNPFCSGIAGKGKT
jgi:hypothetical protein